MDQFELGLIWNELDWLGLTFICFALSKIQNFCFDLFEVIWYVAERELIRVKLNHLNDSEWFQTNAKNVWKLIFDWFASNEIQNIFCISLKFFGMFCKGIQCGWNWTIRTFPNNFKQIKITFWIPFYANQLKVNPSPSNLFQSNPRL